jgi:hypothetical protein
MAKREPLSKFIKNFLKMDDGIQRASIAKWNANTLLAMMEAQSNAIVKSGDLQGSARAVKAKITPQGFSSAFIFGVPYAYSIEKGERKLKNGKVIKLNQKSFANPKGGFHYASKAVDTYEPIFIKDLKDIIGKVWDRI